MRCPSCNAEIAEGKKFCGHCGTKLPPVPAFDDEAPTRLESSPVATAPVPVSLPEQPKPVPAEVSQPATAPKRRLAKQEAPSRPARISPWLAWIIVIIGWGLGGFLNFLGYGSQPIIGTIITGLFWGLSLALALNLSGFIRGLASFLMVMGAWLLATIATQPRFSIYPEWIWGFLMFAGPLVGGYLTGLIVRQTQIHLRLGQVFIITTAWLVCSLVVFIIAHGSFQPGWSFDFTSGAVLGAICGGLTLLVVSSARD
jgi:hypothetical protein